MPGFMWIRAFVEIVRLAHEVRQFLPFEDLLSSQDMDADGRIRLFGGMLL